MMTKAWNNNVNAHSAGIVNHRVDLYTISCISMNATQQMETLLNKLKIHNLKYDMI